MPRPTATTLAQADHDRPLAERGERRSHVRGLLLLAIAAIAFAILRASLHIAFPAGWWRLW